MDLTHQWHKHPGGPGTGPWLSKNCCFMLFRCGASAISCGKRPSKKTSALLWFATLTGFCAAKPDERTKWPFLFTAWEILQLRQLRSASRSQCVPISIVDFECTWTTNHCVCLGLGNEWYHTPPHPTPPHPMRSVASHHVLQYWRIITHPTPPHA